MEKLIGFIPGGGIGDHIISIPVLDFLLELFPDCEFDVCRTVKAQNYRDIIGPDRVKRFRNIYDQTGDQKYSAVFEANEFVNITLTKNFHEENPQINLYYETWQQRMMMMNNTHTIFPRAMNQVGSFGVKMGLDRITIPQWTIGIPPENYKYPKIIHIKEEKPGFKYITFNDGWNVTGSGFRTTKAWSVAGWKEFIKLAKAEGIKVVQLGSTETGQEYDVDVQLRGKTTLAEALCWLKGSMCHIDIEGFFAHAATAMDVPCVILHGPTNMKFFSYLQNTNLLHGACQDCWHLTPAWGRDCMTGNQTCMQHSPDVVIHSVKKILKML